MLEFGVTNPMSFGKQIKRLGHIYHGACLAYDEGVVEGDSVLAEAIWRNLLNGTPSELNIYDCALVVKYIREQKAHLASCDPKLFERGLVRFTDFPTDL